MTKVSTNTVEGQEVLRDFVHREVHYCVSSLIWELAKDEKYLDDLMEIRSQPDPENEDEFIEAYEHWLVTDWLADKLAAKGEMVTKDFMGLTIWGRTCTGQAIYLDNVIEEIYNDLN